MKTSSWCRIGRKVLGLLTFAALAWPACAAPAAYPEATVRIVVPFPAGAAADMVGRLLAKKLGDYWGRTVIVDNRAGAPGMHHAATSPADGYTLVLAAGSSIVTAPMLNPKIPYKPERDFVPVAKVVVNPPVLVVHPSLGVKSVGELVALAKSRPGKLFYSSSGLGSPNHLAMEMFMQMTGTDMVHVPYKGAAPSVQDLLGGQVHLGMNAIPSVLQHIQAGKLTALGVCTLTRSRALPDLPTIDEAGVRGFNFDGWYGLFAPTGTPPAIIEKVSADVQRALRDPELIDQLVSQGSEPAPSSARQFAAFLKEDVARWSKLIKERNLKLE